MEYALQAVKLGTTAIGIRTKEGVVLAAEKRITSKLMEPSSVEKIMEVRSTRRAGRGKRGRGVSYRERAKKKKKINHMCVC